MDESIAGNFEDDVPDKEDHQSDGNSVTLCKTEVLVHTRDAGDCNVGSIYKSDGVKASQDWQKSSIDLSKNSLLKFGILCGFDVIFGFCSFYLLAFFLQHIDVMFVDHSGCQ